MIVDTKKCAALAALCGMVLGGCQTGPQNVVPEVASLTGRGQRSAPAAVLLRGRELYTTRCTECHLPQPIAKYSIAQWHTIVGEMAPRAKLNSDDRSALEAYVAAVRAAP